MYRSMARRPVCLELVEQLQAVGLRTQALEPLSTAVGPGGLEAEGEAA